MIPFRTSLLAVAVAAAAALAAAPRVARAGEPEASELEALSGLDEVETLEVETVSSASRYGQTVASAPASITIVRRDQIDAYGWRTIAEILHAMNGVFTTSDRNYTYVTFRGLGRPGDYNSRILLLVDGHPVNDDVYDQGFIGTDAIVDVDLVERVEVVRGAASALYGGNAVFAVVNVVTRSPHEGASGAVTVLGGTLGTAEVTARYGASGAAGSALVAVSAFRSDGADLHYPEFEAAGLDGQVNGLDWDEGMRVFAKASRGALRLTVAAASRSKGIPTAYWGSLPGDDRTWTRDRRAYAELVWQRSRGRLDTLVKAALDGYRFQGWSAYDDGEGGTYLNLESDHGYWGTAEARFTAHVRGGHALTWGAQLQGHRRQMRNEDLGGEVWLDEGLDGPSAAAYAQGELQAHRAVRAIAGVRYDWSGSGRALSPRLALVTTPWSGAVLKLLGGSSFRPPNAYEQLMPMGFGFPRADLDPEKLHSVEVLYEQAIGAAARVRLGGYLYRASGLIDRTTVAGEATSTFDNLDDATAAGLEVEVERRLWRGAAARLAWAFQDTHIRGRDAPNSPYHLAKAHLRARIPGTPLRGAAEVLFVSSRYTLAGSEVDPYAVANLTAGAAGLLRGRLDLDVACRNVLDADYGDPASSEHPMAVIGRDGRTFRATATMRF